MHELKISGPGKNALGLKVMTHLLERLNAAGGEPLLLTGEGDAFSAGLNLKEVGDLDTQGMETFLTLLSDLTCRLFEYPGPTVALVNGHAIAGGCVLALCCDERIGVANPKAKIGLNELALGLRFPPRILRVLSHAVGPRFLERAVLSAALFDPQTALQNGLLDAVSDDAEALARARLEALAAIPRDAYAAAKRGLRGGISLSSPEEERAFRAEVLPVWTSGEVKRRIAAFFKK